MLADDEMKVRLELLNDEFSARLVRQTQATDRTDTKVTVVIGFALTAAQFLATRTLYLPLAVPAFAWIAASVAAGLWCLKPRPFDDVPDPGAFIKHYSESTQLVMLGVLVGTRVDVFHTNEAQRKAKLLWWRCSLVALVAAAAFSAAAIWLGRH